MSQSGVGARRAARARPPAEAHETSRMHEICSNQRHISRGHKMEKRAHGKKASGKQRTARQGDASYKCEKLTRKENVIEAEYKFSVWPLYTIVCFVVISHL